MVKLKKLTKDYLYILWNKATDDDLFNYRHNLDFLTEDYVNEALSCQVQSCSNNFHKNVCMMLIIILTNV